MEEYPCILFADDEPEIRAMVKMVLEKAGFRVNLAENGAQVVELVQSAPVDLILMDVMMPVLDGIKACRQIRRSSDIPIILLTVNAEEDDLVEGFNAGAYDYIEKPFRTRELIVRIRALLERKQNRKDTAERALAYEDLTLDPKTRQVRLHGEIVSVTAMGFNLLEYFMHHTGEVLSKTELLRDVWAYPDPIGGQNMVEAAIKRLRKDLQDDPKDPHFIKTIWGVGYRFGEWKGG